MSTPSPLALPSPSGLPQLRLVLAVSLDGRLAPPDGGAAQIGGRGDRRVLEEALAWADGALLGAETLRRHGSTCLIHAPDLLAQRRQQGLSDQPVALVASRSGHLPAGLRFFDQPLERWLLLGRAPAQPGAAEASPALPLQCAAVDPGMSPVRGAGADSVSAEGLGSPEAYAPGWSPEAPAPGGCTGNAAAPPAGFARLIAMDGWEVVLRQLAAAGLQRIAVLGGAALAASLLAEDRLTELQLTLCPRLLGGEHGWLAPGVRLPSAAQQGWRLLEQRRLEGEELLLRYGREATGG